MLTLQATSYMTKCCGWRRMVRHGPPLDSEISRDEGGELGL